MRAQFLTPLRLEDVDGGHMVLLEPFKFYSGELKRIVQVLPGFRTDFASIPRGFWNIIPKNGPYDKAAVLHDAGYELQIKDYRGRDYILTKKQSDELFREAMEVVGVPKVRRTLMFWAVRMFGRGKFNEQPVRS